MNPYKKGSMDYVLFEAYKAGRTSYSFGHDDDTFEGWKETMLP